MHESDSHNRAQVEHAGTVVQVGSVYGNVIVGGQASDQPTPRQLPTRPRGCVGRSDETVVLDRSPSLTVLTGPGGIGKTWLATWWAYERLDEFPAGQLFADLHGFSPSQARSPLDVLHDFLSSLGVGTGQISEDLGARSAQFRSMVANKRMLILLDNAANADQVEPLLPGGTTCRVVVTSRDQLRRLTIKYDATNIPISPLAAAGARSLLATRLGDDRVAAESDTADELVAHCDGYPLALSIVAGQAKISPTFPLSVFASGLRRSMSRLRTLDSDDDIVSFRAVLSWSWRTLPPLRASIFAQLGASPGLDISLEAASCLTNLELDHTRRELDGLLEVSLLQQDKPKRWRMHDLVRLVASEAVPYNHFEAERRLIDFYVHTATTADLVLCERITRDELGPPTDGCRPLDLPDRDTARTWFETEHANLLAAQHEAHRLGWFNAVCQLARALDTFHRWCGHLLDNIDSWQAAVYAARHLDDPVLLSRCHRLLGDSYTLLDKADLALPQLERALAIAQDAGDAQSEASCHNALARLLEHAGQYAAGLDHAHQLLRKQENLNNPLGIAIAMNTVGVLYIRLGQAQVALPYCLQALSRFRDLGFQAGIATVLGNLGDICYELGEYSEGLGYCLKAIELCLELKDECTEADSRTSIGYTYLRIGDRDSARDQWTQALVLRRAQGREADVVRLDAELSRL